MMDRLRALAERIGAFFRRGREDAELDEELRHHLDMQIHANLRAGMTPREARRQAHIALGGVDWVSERVRDERWGRPLEDLARDLRFGFRGLRKRPVFAAAAILTLSLGIGMTTTMFTLVDAVLLRPLSGTNVRGMVYLKLRSADGRISAAPTPQLLRLVRDHATSFSGVEAYHAQDYPVVIDGDHFRTAGARASAGLFSFLGVRPSLGRILLPSDGTGTAAPVVVLSHALWSTRFSGRSDVLGRTMRIAGLTYEIVGVLPRDFRLDSENALFWIPAGSPGAFMVEDVPVSGALARLADGVSLATARAELDAIVQNNALDRLADMAWEARVQTPADVVEANLKRAILLLQIAAFLVLLIGCGNLANLLLAQGEARARELAVRASLGAGRGRLIRQLLAESLVWGVGGGVGGTLLTLWALGILPLFLPAEYSGFTANRSVFLVAILAALLSVLLVGLLPAVRGSGRGLSEIIRETASVPGGLWGRLSFRQALVTLEVAMAVLLLVGAGLLLKSFAGLTATDTGFDSRDLLTLRLELPEDRYGDEETQRAFFDQLRVGILEGLPPGMGEATMASGLVEDLSGGYSALVPEGTPEGEQADHLFITWGVAPGYFHVVGVPLLQGREFLEGEGSDGEPVVIINDGVAKRYFPDGDAVGRRLQVDGEWHRVVGVAGSVWLPSLAQDPVGEEQLFFPFRQDAGRGLTVLARAKGDPSATIDRLKKIIRSVDGSVPIRRVASVDDLLADSLAQQRSNALLMVFFSLTALALGAVGIYGVVAYSVSRRIREMGIRLALGASSREVVGRVVLGGFKTVAIGIVVGGVGALFLGGQLSELLHEVTPRDPFVFLLVIAMTTAVSVLATWMPARRAGGAAPVDALRSE